MKTSFKAKIIIDTDKYTSCFSPQEKAGEDIEKALTLTTIKELINQGHYVIEFVDSYLDNEVCPIIIIKI